MLLKWRSKFESFRFLINGVLWGATGTGLAMFVIDGVWFSNIDLGVRSPGIALFIAGGIGVYMMFTTKKIATQLQDSVNNVSGKIDTMSGKIDDMSDHLSGKIDTMSGKIDDMSDHLSGKIDTMSGKIDTMSGKIDDQTDVLKEIRDAVVNLAGVQKPPK